MTTVQTHRVRTRQQHQDESGPRVRDDMTVEVALSVMAGARVEYLLLCDGDDQFTGSVTRVQLAVLRTGATYTDRLRLRDVPTAPFPPSSGPCSFSL
ncbi:CBS domain-containing protein [Streptomyces sp. NPDC060000]|uniref:CBS domain-containing protein n=1 Tax=Streptomyces sp. NPDC060000 TaxID=3347031 RepID=UPI003692BF50